MTFSAEFIFGVMAACLGALGVNAWYLRRTRMIALKAIREARRAQAIACALHQVCEAAGIVITVVETEDEVSVVADGSRYEHVGVTH